MLDGERKCGTCGEWVLDVCEKHEIRCPRCKKISHHPEDVRQRYCGNCHEWHKNMLDVQTVHILRQGLTLCRFVLDVPGNWPPGHVWVRTFEHEKANCQGCLDAFEEWQANKNSTLPAYLGLKEE